jgi:hypothetical protein
MKTIIDYIRSCFCSHVYECIKQAPVFEDNRAIRPIGTKWVYRCKKCGRHKVEKDY